MDRADSSDPVSQPTAPRCDDSGRSPVRSLCREVINPRSQPTGVMVMLVSSAAMYLAMASSVFILRSQVPQRTHCTSQRIEVRSAHRVHGIAQSLNLLEAVEVELVDIRELGAYSATMPCGEPIVRTEGDNSTIIFRMCP